MGAISGGVTGYYLADSWLKDVKLTITGYDFTCGLGDDAKVILALRVTSITLRALGVFLGRHFISYALGANFLFAIPLFILSHDFVLVGNNLSSFIASNLTNGIKLNVDDFRKLEFIFVVKKVSQAVLKNFDDLEALKKDLKGISLDAVIKELKVGTIMEGWKETYTFLTSDSKQPS